MPMYEYACDDCQEITEALRPMADADKAVACEHCSGVKTRRVHSVFAAGRSSERGATTSPARGPGGCGRCGDPHGPCGM